MSTRGRERWQSVVLIATVLCFGAATTVEAQLRGASPLPTRVVLKVKEWKSGAPGTYTMELVLDSGATITVPSIDIDNYLTNLVEEAFKRQQSGAPASAVSAPVLNAPEAIIPRKCAAEWPTDFTMQKHCLEQQKLAVENSLLGQ